MRGMRLDAGLFASNRDSQGNDRCEHPGTRTFAFLNNRDFFQIQVEESTDAFINSLVVGVVQRREMPVKTRGQDD